MSNNSVRKNRVAHYEPSSGRGRQGFLPVKPPQSKEAQDNWDKYNAKHKK